MVCVLDLHFTLEWPWLRRNCQVHISIPIGATFTKLAPTIHLDMIYWYQVVVCVLDLHFTLEWPWLGKILRPYYSTYWSYIHQTCTNCSSWHDLLIPRGGLCPWSTFHASVTKTQNGFSGAPMMVPITIMSSFTFIWYFYAPLPFEEGEAFCFTQVSLYVGW